MSGVGQGPPQPDPRTAGQATTDVPGEALGSRAALRPQPFWHQGPASWKTVFLRTGPGRGRGMGTVQAVRRAMGSDGERWGSR